MTHGSVDAAFRVPIFQFQAESLMKKLFDNKKHEKVHTRKKLESAEPKDFWNVEKILGNFRLGDFSVPSRRL